jgi:hypothetical protein
MAEHGAVMRTVDSGVRSAKRRAFLRAVAALSGSLPLLERASSGQTLAGFQVGWNHPWIAYGHDFGPAWGHDGISTNGWTHETFADTRGFTGTRVVRDQGTGRGALRIAADLRPGDPGRSNGEVHLSLIDHWPFACPRPETPMAVNLSGALVRCRLRLPAGSAGHASSPNGLQLVFKTRTGEIWPSMYTRWENISPSWEGRDVTIAARVSTAEAGYIDPGFDASRVSLIGLKLGMNSSAPFAVADPVYLHEFTAMTEPELALDFERHQFERDVRSVRRRAGEGLSLVRIFVFCDGRASPRFAPDGSVAGLDERFFTDFDALVDVADRTGIRLLPVLLDFHWCAHPETVSGVQLGGRAGIIRDRTLRQTFLERALRPLLVRYGRRDAIYGWDIINEPEWVIRGVPGRRSDGYDLVTLAQMREFATACARDIHRFAPTQLATIGSARRAWLPLWTGTGLDLYQFHWYDGFESQEPFPWPPCSELGLDAPCLVGEVPTAGTRYSAREFVSAASRGGYCGVLFWSYRARDTASSLCAAEGLS